MVVSPQKPHAILVSYPLQGHVIPSVHLAIKLASREVRKSGLDIRYTTVPDGLPIGFDRSLNHDPFMAALLYVFSAQVEEEVQKIVKSGPHVTCLIADTFFVWPGIYAPVKKSDLEEIANGLLESEISFVWVLRPDVVASDDHNSLSDGFRAAAGDRGMIIPWCCQINVLNHHSIGGFLTHCVGTQFWKAFGVKYHYCVLTDQFTN
ncbi:hypothetical protein ACH5RR_009846 [Cinchona calisaya]|uniref:Uncharacterized protein n=1 Tax=Cinchona calisaya TaxID=153742 RepID=A0ABD3AH30_9GENT